MFRIVMATLLMTTTLATAQTTAPACSAQEFRQFDFWAGQWDVQDAQGKLAGRNAVTLEQNGCVLIERWTSASGGTGFSMNHYDPQSKQWKQRWVGMGILLDMSGELRDGVMTLEGPLQYLANGRVTILRGEWSKLPDGRVRQRFTESSDDGKTWTEWFDGYYSRAK